MPGDDITNGELARRIDVIMAELRRFEDRSVTRESYEALSARVHTLEERATYLARVAWGGAILPIVVAIVIAFALKQSP